MANDVTQKEVLVLDTAADSIIAAGSPVHIVTANFAHPTATGGVTVTDAGGTVAKLDISAPAGDSRSVSFPIRPLVLNGLKIIAIAAGGVLYVYTGAK